ncbi:4146_t:CDS:2, partial [Cetraspora pellucida]
DNIESFVIDLAYDGVYRSWPCLKNKLPIDKESFPLIVLVFSHFIIMEQYVNKIVSDYEDRENRPPFEQTEKLKFIRRMPTTTQFNEAQKKYTLCFIKFIKKIPQWVNVHVMKDKNVLVLLIN